MPGASEPRMGELRYSSRGDRVSGRCWWPGSDEARLPIVVIVHAAGASSDAPGVIGLADALLGRGVAAAAIDLPLHGRRADVKLSRGLTADLERGADGALVTEFARQATADLAGVLGVLAERDGVDVASAGIAGLGIGAALAVDIAASQPGVLALARIAARDLAGAGSDEPDPSLPTLDLTDSAGCEATVADFFAGQLGRSADGA